MGLQSVHGSGRSIGIGSLIVGTEQIQIKHILDWNIVQVMQTLKDSFIELNVFLEILLQLSALIDRKIARRIRHMPFRIGLLPAVRFCRVLLRQL